VSAHASPRPLELTVERRRRWADRAATAVVTLAFALAVAPLVSLLWTVASRGVERLDAEFLTTSMRGVVGEGGGALHAIAGTLTVTGIATLVSVPVGILAGVWLSEYGGGRLGRRVGFLVDVMTGIPSIVAGLFAFALFALFLGPGVRMGVMGSAALCVLMIPVVVRSTEEMLRLVPRAVREGAHALGAPKWRVVLQVVLPTAGAGIVTGVLVAVARVVGETAPLLVTTGTVSSLNANPFAGRMETLPVFAFEEYRNPGVPPDPYLARAWAAALTLVAIVLALNLAARLVQRRLATGRRPS
jgi:phosphate transport system permease protein